MNTMSMRTGRRTLVGEQVMQGRRKILVASGVSVTALAAPELAAPSNWRSAVAQQDPRAINEGGGRFEPDELPPLPQEMQAMADQPDLLIEDTQQLGTKEPPAPKKELARRIVAEAMDHPNNRQPYDFALWFRDLGRGKFGADRASYARAWPSEYNPLIVDFFRATGTKPAGDTTAWCAAFVNFCISLAAAKAAGRSYGPAGKEFVAADKAHGTQSASSGSFRCWPQSGPAAGTTSPKVGDIVVWALDGSVNGCAYERGHVGFFERFESDRIIIVGGNQGPEDSEGQSGVTRRDYGRAFKRKIGQVSFHSFRTVDIPR